MSNMSTTIPTQATADDLRVVTAPPPSIEQAQLLIQMMQWGTAAGADEGYMLLHRFEQPPTLSQLRRRHDRGSAEYRKVMTFLASCEAMGTFVKQGILSASLVHDTFWVAGAWRYSEKICKAIRKEAGERRLYENFEALASSAP